jgi:uncharacterized protein
MSILIAFIPLLLVILGLYLAGQLFIHAWPKIKRKYLFYYFLALITVIFISSFILLNFLNHSLLNLSFILGAVLFGALTQLMIFGGLFFLINLLIKKSSWLKNKFPGFKQKKLARFFIILSLCFFVLGSYNAFFPKVKNITLNNWPSETSGLKIVHLSDTHLGLFYPAFYLENLVKKVNKLEADLIIISGDLFDGNDKNLNKYIPALNKFKATTIFVPGNHDHYLDNNQVSKIISQTNIIELKDEAYITMNLEIIGFDYVNEKNKNNLNNREIINLNKEKKYPRIVVNHEPINQLESNNLEANLMLSGHSHRGQIFPFSLITRLIYGKYAYGLANYENMITYTSAGIGTWGPPMRTLFPGEIILFKID